MDEREEQRGATGHEVDCEGEGEGDAEVMLRHGLALINGVGLLEDLKSAADLNKGGAGERVVGEGVLGGEVVETMAGVGVELEGEAKDWESSDGGVGVDDVEGSMD